MEQIRPCPIGLTKSHVFVNGNRVLTHTGSSIQFIRNELTFLREGWSGQGKISRKRENQIIGEIAERFSEVSEYLGIPSDLSLIPEVVSQYNHIISGRRNPSSFFKSTEPLETPA